MTDLEYCITQIDRASWGAAFVDVAEKLTGYATEGQLKLIKLHLQAGDKRAAKAFVTRLLEGPTLAEREEQAKQEAAEAQVARQNAIVAQLEEHAFWLARTVAIRLGLRKGDRLAVDTADGANFIDLSDLDLPERDDADARDSD